jgi:hypothetical protein
MYSSSFQLPGRVNAQIKYIIDNSQNVLDLTKQNKNIFTTQNVFKSGENTNISLFNYDPNSNMAQYLTDNQNVNLYEGGFRYSPILFNVSGAVSMGTYALTSSILTTTSVTSPSYVTITQGDNNYWSGTTLGALYAPYTSTLLIPVTFSAIGISPSTLQVNINYTIFNLTLGSGDLNYSYTTNKSINSGTNDPYRSLQNIPSGYSGSAGTITPLGGHAWQTSHTYSASINLEQTYNPSGGTTTTTTYSSSINDNDSRWIVSASNSGEHIIRLSATQSLYYGGFIFSSASAGLETPVSNFSLSQMDLIRLYNLTSSWGSYNQSEYRVKNVYYGTQDPWGTFPAETNSYYFVTLDRNINPNETAANTVPGYISRYVVLKRSPDETNLIFAFSGSSNITDDGLVFPQYIDPIARENSGNVVKALKQQNLI